MIRLERSPRPDWIQKVEEFGLTFHTIDGEPYWTDSAAYRLEPGEIRELHRATLELQTLCLEAVDRLICRNELSRLEIPPQAHKAIAESWQRQEPSLYGRFDLRYDGSGPPKLLEYNADTPTSLLEAAVIQWHWVQEAEPEADQFNSIWEDLVARWASLKEQGALNGERVHFACQGPMEDVMTTAVLMDTAQEAGLKVGLMPMRKIGWDLDHSRFVDQELQPIRTLFKLYPWEWLLEDKFAAKALDVYAGLTWIEPIWKMALSNKAILAILWEMFPEHPNLLPAFLDGPHGMTDYVRKPFLGREGSNISIFQSGDEIHIDGPYDRGGSVCQSYAPLPVFEGNHAVIGSWVIGGKPAGIGIRESDGPITEDTARFVPHFFFVQPPDDSIINLLAVNVQTLQMSPIPVVMLRHTGPYEQISPVFDTLWDWVGNFNVPAQRSIGIYWDNPDYTPASRLRSAACVEVPQGWQIADTGGLPMSLEYIAGGAYVTTRYVGPYEELGPVWSNFTNYIEGAMGRRISSNPAFEVYVNDPSNTPPNQLITELYMPVL